MLAIHTGDDTDWTQISVSGDLTFNVVEQLRTSLLERLPEARRLRLILAEIGELDLAGVQLLYALCRTADARSMTIEIHPGAAAERIDRMLRFAGLAPIPWGQP